MVVFGWLMAALMVISPALALTVFVTAEGRRGLFSRESLWRSIWPVASVLASTPRVRC